MVTQCRKLLSQSEKTAADRFLDPQDGRAYVLAHALLRNVLATHLGQAPNTFRFGTGAHGRPFLLGPSPVNFNLSHTQDLAACGIYGNTIGIDVEKLRDNLDLTKLAGRVLTKNELATLGVADKPSETRFFDYWTLKEAYAKARGVGITLTFNRLDFRIVSGGEFEPHLHEVGDRQERWFMRTYSILERFRLSIAVIKSDTPPRIFLHFVNPLTLQESECTSSVIASQKIS